MNGVIYCRVSSKEQLEGTSLEVQEAACRDYARAKDIQILKVFLEQGESAKFADRTQLIELLDFCREKKGTVQTLLVWKIDRFARNVSDHFSVKATLGKYGVRIMSVTEPIDTNPEGRLMETILAGFAQFDNDIRAVRTVQGMRRKLQDGIFPWGPPFGYQSSVVAAEKKTQPDRPDDAVFAVLQKAWKEFATGAYTQAAIGRLMQTWGIATKPGRPLSPQFLRQLFTNSYYAGFFKDPWSGEEYEGKHVPMVTREDFAKVQRVIARRNRSTPHEKEHPDFPLRGVVRCDECFHYFTGGFSRGRSRRYAYYVCHAPSCPRRGKSHAAGDIHDQFDSLLDRVTPRPDVIIKLEESVMQAAGERQKTDEIQNGRQKAAAQQKLLGQELRELIRMRAQNLITDQEFMDQKRRIMDQQSALASRGQRSLPIDEARHQIREIVNPLANLRGTWHDLQPPFRRRFNRILLPIGFVNGKSRTAQVGLLFSAFETSTSRLSNDVSFPSEKLNLIIAEIQGFWSIVKGIEEPQPDRKTRFENSHRNHLRWRKLNQEAA